MNRLSRRREPDTVPPPQVRADLRTGVIEGSCYSLMVGVGETWFGAFFIASGVSNFAIGLLATLPILIGSGLQLATPWGIRAVGSYRRWSVLTAALQGAGLLAMGALSWQQATGFWLLLPALVLYWGGSLAVGPAWNTWMEFVIPRQVRARYLSRRMRVCQAFLLGGVLGAGLLLHSGSGPLAAFALLFAVGGAMRLLSALCLGRQSELRGWLAAHELRARLAGADDRLDRAIRQNVPFFVAIQFAVFISGPFFTPFMMRNLGMNFVQFMFLIVLGYLGRVATLHWAGNLARRHGPGRLLWWGAVGLVPLAGLWVFHQSYLFLAVIQFAGGMAWGCYELAMSIVFIEKIPGHHRTRVLSMFGLGNGVAMVSGSVLGGSIISGLGGSTAGFLLVFLLSTLARIAALGLFPRGLAEAPLPGSVEVPSALVTASPHVNGRSLVRPFASVPGAADEEIAPGPSAADSEATEKPAGEGLHRVA